MESMFRLTNRRAASRHAGVLVGLCLVVGRPCLADPLPAPCLPPMARPSSTAVDGMYGGMIADASATAVGAASCATASCHGGPAAGNHDVQSFAATLWATTDPHAGAYETLHEPRSRRMAAMLGIEEPHRARQCLVCHSVQAERPEPLPQDVLADGVSCGACHGDATKWLAIHHLPEWKDVGPEARARMDFREMSDAASRTRTCIPCHVGDGSREVDHDLVAAGHPRLAFEFAAYQRLWPRHWSPRGKAESQADFAERAWAAGQAETLAAVARLVAVRARRAVIADSLPVPGTETIDSGGRPSPRWPEFAEFDCYACHRALSPERVAAGSQGPLRNPFPGAPSWQPWSVSAARLLAAAVDDPAVGKVGHAAVGLRAAFEPDWTASDRRRLELVIERAETVS